MSRLDYDQVDLDAAAEHRRERDHHREPGSRQPRRDDRDLNPRRAFQAGVVAGHPSATIEIPCPIPDCGSSVYAPGDSDRERIDCTDCGAALLTRLGLDGTVTLEVTEDAVVTDDPDAPPPPISAGHHVAAFDASEPPDLFPLGGWQRRTFEAINAGMSKKR